MEDNHIYYGKPTYVKYEIVAAKRKKKHIHTHGGVQKNKISNRLITEKTELSHFFAALRFFFFILKENQSLKISFIEMKSILKGLPSVDVEDEKKMFLMLRFC